MSIESEIRERKERLAEAINLAKISAEIRPGLEGATHEHMRVVKAREYLRGLQDASAIMDPKSDT